MREDVRQKATELLDHLDEAERYNEPPHDLALDLLRNDLRAALSTQEQGVEEIKKILSEMEERLARLSGAPFQTKGYIERLRKIVGEGSEWGWAPDAPERFQESDRLATDPPRDEPDGERVFECSFCHQAIRGKGGHTPECPGFREPDGEPEEWSDAKLRRMADLEDEHGPVTAGGTDSEGREPDGYTSPGDEEDMQNDRCQSITVWRTPTEEEQVPVYIGRTPPTEEDR